MLGFELFDVTQTILKIIITNLKGNSKFNNFHTHNQLK